MYCNTPDLQLQHGNSGMACGVRRTPLRVTHVHASLTVTNTPLRAGERWRFNFHSALATPHSAQRSADSAGRSSPATPARSTNTNTPVTAFFSSFLMLLLENDALDRYPTDYFFPTGTISSSFFRSLCGPPSSAWRLETRWS